MAIKAEHGFSLKDDMFNADTTHVLREVFFFQAEDGIRDLVRSRGLGDV